MRARVPSFETRFKTLRRMNNELQRQLNTARIASEAYRARATKAEQECAEWRKRFDALLLRTPEAKP
jgi:FtsZ-binding cell division protein ZapB